MSFFGVRKTFTHVVAFGFFGVLVPLSIATPGVSIPLWALLHLPVSAALATAVFTWELGSVPFCLLFVLFENAMSVVKIWAVVAGEF